jgi:hypothetical protein
LEGQFADKITEVGQKDFEKTRERLPEQRAVVETDFRDGTASAGKGGVVIEVFELVLVLVDVDDDGVFRDLVDHSGQICAERYAGIEHLQQHRSQPAEFSRQITAVMIRRAAEQPAGPPEMCARSVRGIRFCIPEHACFPFNYLQLKIKFTTKMKTYLQSFI